LNTDFISQMGNRNPRPKRTPEDWEKAEAYAFLTKFQKAADNEMHALFRQTPRVNKYLPYYDAKTIMDLLDRAQRLSCYESDIYELACIFRREHQSEKKESDSLRSSVLLLKSIGLTPKYLSTCPLFVQGLYLEQSISLRGFWQKNGSVDIFLASGRTFYDLSQTDQQTAISAMIYPQCHAPNQEQIRKLIGQSHGLICTAASPEELRHLVQKQNLDINQRILGSGQTILHFTPCIDVFNEAVALGADLNAVDNQGRSVLEVREEDHYSSDFIKRLYELFVSERISLNGYKPKYATQYVDVLLSNIEKCTDTRQRAFIIETALEVKTSSLIDGKPELKVFDEKEQHALLTGSIASDNFKLFERIVIDLPHLVTKDTLRLCIQPSRHQMVHLILSTGKLDVDADMLDLTDNVSLKSMLRRRLSGDISVKPEISEVHEREMVTQPSAPPMPLEPKEPVPEISILNSFPIIPVLHGLGIEDVCDEEGAIKMTVFA